jgi:xylan 1,4-beta-xylosidase
VQLEGSHATVDPWVTRGAGAVTILLTNFALARHPIATALVRLSMPNAAAPVAAPIQRSDTHHTNAKRLWQELGALQVPDGAMLAPLRAASVLRHDVQPVRYADGLTRVRRRAACRGYRRSVTAVCCMAA